jgi:putative membrane protein
MVEEFVSREMINHGIGQMVAMLLTIFFIPRLWITSPVGALGILIAIAMINATFWDASLFFFLPDTLSANSLKLLATNGVLFWILVKLVPGIRVQGVLPALVAPLLFTVISTMLNMLSAHLDWIAFIAYIFSLLTSFRDSFK